MANQGKIFLEIEVCAKEILCLFLYLFYAWKRSLAFLIMQRAKRR